MTATKLESSDAVRPQTTGNAGLSNDMVSSLQRGATTDQSSKPSVTTADGSQLVMSDPYKTAISEVATPTTAAAATVAKPEVAAPTTSTASGTTTPAESSTAAPAAANSQLSPEQQTIQNMTNQANETGPAVPMWMRMGASFFPSLATEVQQASAAASQPAAGSSEATTTGVSDQTQGGTTGSSESTGATTTAANEAPAPVTPTAPTSAPETASS